MRRWRHRDESGTALIEVTWLSLLLMIPLLYIVIAVFEVQRSAFAVSAAARAAGRAYAVAPSEASGLDRAGAAAGIALADQKLDEGLASVTVTCTPEPGNCLTPGSVIQVDVGYPVPLPLVPSALGGDTPSIRVDAVHRVPYGTFREDRP